MVTARPPAHYPPLRAAVLGTIAAASLAHQAGAAAPMSYMWSAGRQNDVILPLNWFVLGVSVLVVVVSAALVVLGVVRRRRAVAPGREDLPRLERSGAGLRWIAVGTILSIVPLLVAMAWTVVSLADIQSPPGDAALTLEIRGHQWWWEVQYVDPKSHARSFTTANEIHVPVGQLVRIKLTTADVIHSFWVPALGGKTDLIPGQVNETWLIANAPGEYRGQCVEYCGQQHAHMALKVFAQAPDEFGKWWDRQLAPAPPPASDMVQLGQEDFTARCGACHAVRGTLAGGIMGPDLTHLMSRTTIGSGAATNTPANLRTWVDSPDHFKPGVLMPAMKLDDGDLDKLTAWLLTLK